MILAHPEIAVGGTNISKTKLKLAIDLIFRHIEQIKLFETMCEDPVFRNGAWFLYY
jgi:hypothetical protein